MFIFFFNDTATTEIYTLSLHDALPIFGRQERITVGGGAISLALVKNPVGFNQVLATVTAERPPDRKSTRLNSSHANISYAVFCLKKKKRKKVTAFSTIYIIHLDHVLVL